MTTLTEFGSLHQITLYAANEKGLGLYMCIRQSWQRTRNRKETDGYLCDEDGRRCIGPVRVPGLSSLGCVFWFFLGGTEKKHSAETEKNSGLKPNLEVLRFCCNSRHSHYARMKFFIT